MKISYKLVLIFIFIALLPTLTIGYLSATEFRDQIIIFSAFILFITIIIGFFYGKIMNLEIRVKERTAELEALKNNLEKTEETKMALFNIVEDVKQSEINLKEERDRSQAIISSMGEGLLVADIKNNIVLMNKKAENILETPIKEAIGKNLLNFITFIKKDKEVPPEEQPINKMFQTGKLTAIDLEDDFYLKIPSGKIFPVEMIVSPLRGDGITASVIVFRDVSKEKALDEAKNSFISVASHQLRTPLTSIRWYTEILGSEDAGPLNENQKSFVSRVYNSALKLNEVINLLLSMAKIESGKPARKIIKIDLTAFTNDIIEELEPQFKQKNININLIPPKETVEVNYDASMLRQIITNFLSNTIRYANQDGHVEIKMEKKDKELVYSVKDDGIGVPANQQDKIFNKFFRADNASTAVPDGSGLGLSLIKALVEMNNGKVWFESPAFWIDKDGKEEKKGSIFYFTMAL